MPELNFLSEPAKCQWCLDNIAVVTTDEKIIMGWKLCNECVKAKVVIEV